MGKPLSLTTKDSHRLGAYRADPAGKPLGGVVVVQEIFGVNHHIRSVCDRLASAGYVAIAPAIFDRSQPNFQCGYSPDEVANARKFIANPDWAAMLCDTQAAIDAVKSVGPVGIIGFCLGGSVAYAAATRLSVPTKETVPSCDLRPAVRASLMNAARGVYGPTMTTASGLASSIAASPVLMATVLRAKVPLARTAMPRFFSAFSVPESTANPNPSS